MSFIKAAIFACGALCAALAGMNIVISLKCPRLVRIDMPIDGLPEHLRNLRILHISDIHNTSKTRIDINIWNVISKANFDLAVITGDMTADCFDQILPLKSVLIGLANRVPVFFVDGNHEQAHYRQMKTFLESCGIEVLDNKRIDLDINGETLAILGIRDYYYQKWQNFKPFERLIENEVKCGFRLLLSHQPQIVDKLSYFEDILILSGHTHGGQIRLPFMNTIIAPGQGLFPKYGNGFYKVKNCYLYVSRGIGTSRIPVRFFNRPEVAILRLCEK